MTIPDPGLAVVISRDVLMGAYHFFIACQKHVINNKKAVYEAYWQEYDRCASAGYDCYTCHHQGVYACNATWPLHNPGIPMVAPQCDFPTLVLPPPTPAPVGLGSQWRKERGPPFVHPPPSPSFLPSSFAYWLATYPGATLAPNFILPPLAWKGVAAAAGVAGVTAALAGLPAPGSLKYPRY